MKDKIKNLNKTKTLIIDSIYNSHYSNYSYETSNGRFINACYQLVEEFPNTFYFESASMVHAKIKMRENKLKHVFDLLKYNEEKIIGKV